MSNLARAAITAVLLASGLSTSARSATICSRAQFAKEMEYRSILFGVKRATPQEAAQAGKDYDEILARYCRKVRSLPREQTREHIGDNCYQLSGIYGEERVYWGQCLE
jgi:hypothetical protein